ncbi:MAG: NAD(P)-dependent oxidoreductase [Cellvibrionaceae bacterium]
MKVIIIGGSGDVGRRTVKEALNRGHTVTAVTRTKKSLQQLPQTVKKIEANINNISMFNDNIDNSDLIISAIRPSAGEEETLVLSTQAVLKAAANLNTRVLIVGGAARLKLNKESNETVLTSPGFLPEEIIPIARACQAQYEVCLAEKEADWTYISPPAMLVPGIKTGHYRVGTDTLLTDQEGHSHISMEDFASAIMDEAESPHHKNSAFTVAY